MNKRTYGKFCCVVNCKNTQYNTKNVHFYSFSMKPHKVEQREKWIKAVRIRNADGSLWQPNKYTKICSEHLIANAKSEHPLSPSFLPTRRFSYKSNSLDSFNTKYKYDSPENYTYFIKKCFPVQLITFATL
ncbi:hypothetical protein NQ318_023283 [Aromia moschata]|uniref:THAP-type domain-containing protein n=1 Tax=Aromia moschata TaxID=1265417 RepID=A0AAV8Y4G4_9CUCU|nr:hypothetical protein NQ318_023283 [Aromia moschata]